VNTLDHPRPLRKDGVTLHRAHGEITLYDPDEDMIHVVNSTAAAIWELCDGETDDSEMVGAICHLTGMPVEIVQEDVAHLLAGFEEAHLISWVGRNGSAPEDSGG
jgi:hypothetical protein